MLRIRFSRTGKKHQAFFKIVVVPKENPPKGGKFLDEVGFYNPLTKEKQVNEEKVKKWLDKGAKPSGRVHNLLVEEGIIEAEKVPVHTSSEEQEEVSEEKSEEESGEQEQQKEKEEEKEEQEQEEKESSGEQKKEKEEP